MTELDALTRDDLDALADAYTEDAPAVAKLCDEKLDRSGGLLGRVRNAVRASGRTPGYPRLAALTPTDPAPALDAQAAALLDALDRRNVHSAGDLERYDLQGIDIQRLQSAIAAHQTRTRAVDNGEKCVPQCARDIAREYAALAQPRSETEA